MTSTDAPRVFEPLIPAGERYPATPAFAILPPGARRGVVVVHEIFGRQPEIDRVVHRFAANGYAAVAPDLFSAWGRFNCVRRTFEAMKSGRGPVVEQAVGVREWLCHEAALAPARVGIIGFCFGGGFALAVGRGWGAVSTNYGEVPTHTETLSGMGPTIGCYGARDRVLGHAGAQLVSRLRPLGVEVEAHTFEGVGHSFLTDGHHPVLAALTWPLYHVEYKPETAEQAWTKILGFFDKHLGAAD